MTSVMPTAKEIFFEAIEIESSAERRAFVDRACADDPARQAEVAALLAAHGQAGNFLGGDSPTVDPPPISERPGTKIGPYKLLQQIGEGGFGVVFMAEQQQPVVRRVALKIIKPGMDSKEVIARFEAERQALAMMDHPNIAKVLDGGTAESGRPYFVMELVAGVPITEFCEQNDLPPSERLKLFTAVCRAIHHAHHKGVVHRDIKSSNVLVTLHDGEPVVKVIDFGVAKALNQRLTEKTLFTNFRQMVGTPLYMSPEQAELSGLSLDHRTDIYSLGVLLYELLTGTTPFTRERFTQAAYDEIRRIIREEDPPKPSVRLSSLSGQAAAKLTGKQKVDRQKLPALVRGDLDWIVMKALEKDRRRRYESASDFAADIERHLKHEPVLASPPSLVYRARKFVRRNRGLVTMASVAVVMLAIGLAIPALHRALPNPYAALDRALAEQNQLIYAAAKTDRWGDVEIHSRKWLQLTKQRVGPEHSFVIIPKLTIIKALQAQKHRTEELYQMLDEVLDVERRLTEAERKKLKHYRMEHIGDNYFDAAVHLATKVDATPLDLQRAEQYAQRLSELKGDDGMLIFVAGMADVRRGEYAAARLRMETFGENVVQWFVESAAQSQEGNRSLASDWYLAACDWMDNSHRNSNQWAQPVRQLLAERVGLSQQSMPTSPDELVAIYDRLIATDPQQEKLYYRRGIAYARLGNWVQADADFLRIPNRRLAVMAHVAALFELKGGGEEFSQACAEAFHQSRNDQWYSAREGALLGLLPQSSVTNLNAVLLTTNSFKDKRSHPSMNCVRGITFYRMGRFRDALTQLDASRNKDAVLYRALNLLFSAMAHHQLGNHKQALEFYQKSEQFVYDTLDRPDAPPVDWYDAVIVRSLIKPVEAEAAGLLKIKLPEAPATSDRQE